MEFANATGLPGGFLVGSTSDLEQLGMVASKVTYVLNERGGLDPIAVDQMWPVIGEPSVVNGVTLLPELDFRKEGIDLIVMGDAISPARRPVTRMHVSVRCGAVDHSVAVFGDRRWEKSWGRFRISEPQPFEMMPLTNDRAFGGSALLNDEAVVHSINPDGRGFAMSKNEVAGKPLPNLETPSQLISSWQQEVIPACMFRPKGPLLDASGPNSMAALAASPDPVAMPLAITRRLFNQAVPTLICPRGKLGTTLRLSGFDAGGDLCVPLPAETAVPGRAGPTIHVAIGALRSRFPLSISTIVVLVPQRVVVITWLGLFRYLFRPEEKRRAELRWYGEQSVPAPRPDQI